MCDLTHSYVWHDSFICVTWLIHMGHHSCRTWLIHTWHDSFIWDTTHVGHDSSIRDLSYSYVSHYLLQSTVAALERVMSSARSATQLQHHCNSVGLHVPLQSAVAAGAAEGRLCGMTRSCVWHDSFIHGGQDSCICDIAHSYMWHGSFVTWLIRLCGMAHSYMWHGSFIYVTWLIHICDMAHSCMWHGSFMYVTWLIHVCDMAHSHCDTTLLVLRQDLLTYEKHFSLQCRDMTPSTVLCLVHMWEPHGSLWPPKSA